MFSAITEFVQEWRTFLKENAVIVFLAAIFFKLKSLFRW